MAKIGKEDKGKKDKSKKDRGKKDRGKTDKSKKDRGKKGKGKKGKDKKKKTKAAPSESVVVPPQPKPDPCEVECPIYFMMDVRKCLRSPTYDKFHGPKDQFIYFKDLNQIQGFFEKLRNVRERRQQRQEACVAQILEQFAPNGY